MSSSKFFIFSKPHYYIIAAITAFPASFVLLYPLNVLLFNLIFHKKFELPELIPKIPEYVPKEIALQFLIICITLLVVGIILVFITGYLLTRHVPLRNLKARYIVALLYVLASTASWMVLEVGYILALEAPLTMIVVAITYVLLLTPLSALALLASSLVIDYIRNILRKRVL